MPQRPNSFWLNGSIKTYAKDQAEKSGSFVPRRSPAPKKAEAFAILQRPLTGKPWPVQGEYGKKDKALILASFYPHRLILVSDS